MKFWEPIARRYSSVSCRSLTPEPGIFYITYNQLIYDFDFFSNFSAKETHQIAEAAQEKTAQLRAAFGLGEYYVDGSSFDPKRKEKEEAAKALAMAEKKYS